MGFTKIEDADLTNIGVIGLPDTPGLSTAAMQAKLEETSRSVVIPKHNGLIDELEDVTAAENIGMTPPTGRTGTTVKTVIDSVSNDLATLESGAVKDAYKTIESGGSTFIASGEDTFKINAGSNVTITPLVGDKGISISATGGGGTSIGDMLMSDYDRDGSVKSASSSGNGIKDYVSTAISGKADSSSLSTVATTGAYSDLSGTPTLSTVATTGDYNDLSNKPTVPTKTSDLTNDSNFVADASYVHTDNNYDATAKGIVDGATAAINAKSTVAWSQNITTGQKIATVTIDGTPTDVYAPTGGGGGGGGAVDSVNGQSGTVVLDLNDINDVTFSGLAQNDAVVRNGSGKWVNIPLPASALSGSYGDLTGKPNLATVATTGAYSDLSGTPALATVATSGSYNDLSNTPTVPTKVSDLTNDSGYQTASDVSTAISGKADTSSLGDLAYIDIDGASSTKVLQGDGTWVVPSTGGHTMNPLPTSNPDEDDVVNAISGAINTNDKVASLYGIQKWSNATIKTLYTTVAQGVDTVGSWTDTWKTDNVRTGWLWDSSLHGILDATENDVEITFVFDVADEEVVSVYAYRVDDDVQNGGVDGGAIAIKLNGAIQNSSGVKIGVNLKRQRTEVGNLIVL